MEPAKLPGCEGSVEAIISSKGIYYLGM
ncbi:hypothetical protein C5167_004889 [Papaver somniferum]|uniref:Uncharacterized protein n=1 Tax=Papaver somniferum TaxID=3469 RepID=A0A4Y7J9T9_PAPSO|nr:hypothetical protein C5167_004889 [Papaver somniferum]